MPRDMCLNNFIRDQRFFKVLMNRPGRMFGCQPINVMLEGHQHHVFSIGPGPISIPGYQTRPKKAA